MCFVICKSFLIKPIYTSGQISIYLSFRLALNATYNNANKAANTNRVTDNKWHIRYIYYLMKSRSYQITGN